MVIFGVLRLTTRYNRIFFREGRVGWGYSQISDEDRGGYSQNPHDTKNDTGQAQRWIHSSSPEAKILFSIFPLRKSKNIEPSNRGICGLELTCICKMCIAVPLPPKIWTFPFERHKEKSPSKNHSWSHRVFSIVETVESLNFVPTPIFGRFFIKFCPNRNSNWSSCPTPYEPKKCREI